MNFRREPSLQLKLNSTTFSPGVEGLIAFSDLLKDALKDVKQEPNSEVNLEYSTTLAHFCHDSVHFTFILDYSNCFYSNTNQSNTSQ